jgi:hypothetical protein
MSGRRAKAIRRAAGNPPKPVKQPTALIDASYVQMPVDYDPVKREYRYRSGKQVRKYLARRGVDVDTLEQELQAIMASYVAAEAEAEAQPA